jgi:hypothetical protein
MTIEIKGIKDSISPDEVRITTFQLRYPRFIHAEFMTHRVFSRNASSSRAIPIKKQIEAIIKDPAIPMHWGKNQKGMQAEFECNEAVRIAGLDFTNRDAWLYAMEKAIEIAEAFDRAGYHKQIVNRLLEPFSHINVLCTSTTYSNFIALRNHKDAMHEMQVIGATFAEYLKEPPQQVLAQGKWHLPYVDTTDGEFVKQSVARSARLSYLTFDMKESTLDDDLLLYDKLVGSHPIHASPAEHQATPDYKLQNGNWLNPSKHGNLTGYIQYRKLLVGESL